MVRKIREATLKEKEFPCEIIPAYNLEKYKKRIERKNLKEKGESVSFGSMHLPYGIIYEYRIDTKEIVIHSNWKQILMDTYYHQTLDIYIEVGEDNV